MYDDNFNYAIEKVLKHEGGLSDHINDPGGTTNYGVSLRYLINAGIDINGDGNIDVYDIYAIDKEKAIDIYYHNWWIKYKYNLIQNKDIAAKLLDFSVNIGPFNINKILQQSINFYLNPDSIIPGLAKDDLVEDGIIGPKTIDAIKGIQSEGFDRGLITIMKGKIISHYFNLVDKNPKLRVFLRGWINRVNDN